MGYALLQKYQPTIMKKEKGEDNKKFWEEVVPGEMKKLQGLLEKEGKLLDVGELGKFTATPTVGELYLFAMLYQMELCSPDFLNSTRCLKNWYIYIKGVPEVAKVLAGTSAMGELRQYFIPVS